jgi:menaquinone-specific isochorismate synthase
MTVCEQEIDPIDFPSYLAMQPLYPKWYQKCRETGIETAAIGAVELFSQIPETLSSHRLYGAISFPASGKDLFWKDFPTNFFFLPQIEIIQSPNRTIRRTRNNPPILNAKKVFSDLIQLTSPPIHLPSYDVWQESVANVLSYIQKQEIQKLVLARRTTFTREGEPFAWLSHLLQTSRSSTVFALQMKPTSLFLGATPEHLYLREQRKIKTEAIAGTQKRDSAARMKAKDHLEVEYVKLFLEDILSSCCENFSSDQTSALIQTSHVQHLRYKLHGDLKPNILDKELLALFHPTPAVGGFPKQDSLEKLCSLEPFDRGLYAGAMGWISQDDASFAVTIRSALIESTFLHAFAGLGIVLGSEADKEWLELESKIAHWRPSCP